MRLRKSSPQPSPAGRGGPRGVRARELAEVTLQRVVAEPAARAAPGGRSSNPVTLPISAASCNLRNAIGGTVTVTSPSTVETAPLRRLSSIDHSTSISRRAWTSSSRRGSRPNAATPGPYRLTPCRPGSRRHQTTLPSPPARPASNTALKPMAAAPASAATISCSRARGSPPPGRTASIWGMPSGSASGDRCCGWASAADPLDPGSQVRDPGAIGFARGCRSGGLGKKLDGGRHSCVSSRPYVHGMF